MKERRRTIRYRFTASAEVIDEKSQKQLSTRVAELSLFGCYFEVTTPFPTGTPILVKIARGLVFFEARGRVIYSRPNKGMGVAFRSVHPYFLEVLQGWLSEAEKDRQKLRQPVGT